MAFKMKGNPYKMGAMATKSALKQTKKPHSGTTDSPTRQFNPGDYYDTKTDERKLPMDMKSPTKMKSPVKDYSQNQYHSMGDSRMPSAHPHKKRTTGRGGLVEDGAGPINTKKEGVKSPVKNKQPEVKGHNRPGEEEVMHNIAKHPARQTPNAPDLRKKKA